MKYKIIFSENAKMDLTNIVNYISKSLLEPNIAAKIFQQIVDKIKTLDEFPNRYSLCTYEKWRTVGLRVLPVSSYLVFYIVDELNFVVKVYRVIYNGREIENQLKDKILFE